MKHLNIILLVVIASAITSSSCQMLQEALGGLGGGGDGTTLAPGNNPAPSYVGLTGDSATGDMNLSSGSSKKLGYVASSSAPADPKADANYLYGIFKAN